MGKKEWQYETSSESGSEMVPVKVKKLSRSVRIAAKKESARIAKLVEQRDLQTNPQYAHSHSNSFTHAMAESSYNVRKECKQKTDERSHLMYSKMAEQARHKLEHENESVKASKGGKNGKHGTGRRGYGGRSSRGGKSVEAGLKDFINYCHVGMESDFHGEGTSGVNGVACGHEIQVCQVTTYFSWSY